MNPIAYIIQLSLTTSYFQKLTTKLLHGKHNHNDDDDDDK